MLSPSHPREITIRLDHARAHWLTRDLIAWPDWIARDHVLTLHASATGALAVEDGAVVGADRTVTLQAEPGGLDPALLDHGWRHIAHYRALRLPSEETPESVAELLRGEIAVACTDADGRLVELTGVQLPGVLDDLYADAASKARLGTTVDGHGQPTLRVWAPTARQVTLHRCARPTPEDPLAPLADAVEAVALRRDDATGVWEVTLAAGWLGAPVVLEVTVFSPQTGGIVRNVVTDPYSVALTADGAHTLLIDPDDPALAPEGWDELAKPATGGSPSVYELHIRDHSIHDDRVPATDRGTYRAFTHGDSRGMRHLTELAQAGLTHVHLLPCNDIATIPDRAEDRVTPDIAWPDDPASEEPQRLQQAVRDRDGFNWGYDPRHFLAPEGSYATDPDGPVRVREVREMVAALNRAGLRVVLDVVFNHVHGSGQHADSVLDRVVPGYYLRLDGLGHVEASTCCPNTAAEHRMMEQLIVDAVVHWARAHKVDGFRFDLMGHPPKQTLLRVREALDALTLAEDGVDGSAILLYGEGWDFGEVAGGRQFTQATQRPMAGTGIATFNDRLRDAARGGTPFGPLREQGFLTGLATAPNEDEHRSPHHQREQARWDQTLIELGLAGNLADLALTAPDGATVRGAELTYAGSSGAGYTASPREQVVYVEAHDNETLFDLIQMRAPWRLTLEERARLARLGLSLTALAQGIAFFHAGSDLLRSKSLDRDSYASGDWFNRLDWSGEVSAFGSGLPPAESNAARWPLQRAVLRRAPRPTAEQAAATAAHLRELLAIRRSTSLLHLPSARAVRQQVRFHSSDRDLAPGLIVMELSGGDPAEGIRGLLAVFNAHADATRVAEPGIAQGPWRLHPVQQGSADARVRQRSWHTAADHAFHVPGRTTAVFVR